MSIITSPIQSPIRSPMQRVIPVSGSIVDLTALYGSNFTVTQEIAHSEALYPATNVIDGDTATFNHTSNNANPNVRINFTTPLNITRVQVTNRDGSGARLNGAVVTLRDALDATVLTLEAISGASDLSVHDFVLTSRTRANQLVLTGAPNEFLHVAEIQVFGEDTSVFD